MLIAAVALVATRGLSNAVGEEHESRPNERGLPAWLTLHDGRPRTRARFRRRWLLSAWRVE